MNSTPAPRGRIQRRLAFGFDVQVDDIAGRYVHVRDNEQSAETVILDQAAVIVPGGRIGVLEKEINVRIAGDAPDLAVFHGASGQLARPGLFISIRDIWASGQQHERRHV